MTTREIAEYYANLLILEYHGKPKANATIIALVTPIIMDQLPGAIIDGFSITGDDLAVGKQLDVLGKYIGIDRSNYGRNGNVITLTDSDYVILLLFGLITNSLSSSYYEIRNAIFQSFENNVQVFDFQNMRMSYFIDSSIGSEDLIDVLASQKLLPKPVGVQLADIVYAPIQNNFFGFQGYESTNNSKPFNTYDNYSLESPWLSYDFTL